MSIHGKKTVLVATVGNFSNKRTSQATPAIYLLSMMLSSGLRAAQLVGFIHVTTIHEGLHANYGLLRYNLSICRHTRLLCTRR